MTATSHPKRSFMRLASMESLGFFDAPGRVWTTPSIASTPETAASFDPSQTTELVVLPTGRHSRHARPTGELVRDMWDSTELHAPSLVDWAPHGFGTKHLGRRRFRWPMLLLLIVTTLALAGAALWLYKEPGNAATMAMGQVRAEAEALSIAIDQVSPLIPGLDSERLPEANQDASVYLEMGERAKAMFAASADLPTDDSADRSAAAAAAGLAIDASHQLIDATAYRTALEPALTLPLLETDSNLTDLTTATQAFTEWRAGLESVRAALPTGVAAQASAALEELSAGLEATQTDYLDALRTDNRTAAVEALGALRAELQTVRQAMLTDIGEISTEVSGLIDEARAGLARLLG
ncbi:MAG: hypothetical protein ACRDWS_01025 [Acidimicrobiia bacterium]